MTRVHRPRYTPDDGLLPALNRARKALVGLVVPGLVVLGNALRDGSDAGGHVSAAEWVAVAIAALGTGSLVYGIRNGTSPDPETSTPEV